METKTTSTPPTSDPHRLSNCEGGSGPRQGLLDVKGVVAFDNPAAPKRKHQGQGFLDTAEAWDFGKDTLGSEHHPARSHVVLRAVPRAHQAPGLVNAAIGQVTAEVPAAPSDRKPLAVGYSRLCSNTSRTARSRTSYGYLFRPVITPSSQGLESPTYPGRFTSPSNSLMGRAASASGTATRT